MVEVGKFNNLKVIRIADFGVYLDDGNEGILLPKRFVPSGTIEGSEIKVFIYHDGEGRIIATTQTPFGVLGDILKLKVVSITEQGAFMDFGLMKDLFVPKSQQVDVMRVKGEYIVKIYLDEQTGRIAATERLEQFLQNEELTVKEMDNVDLLVWRKTDIGYLVIINNIHTGVLHSNEIYRQITSGDKLKGFIKRIKPGTKDNNFLIDVAAGTPGYQRVEGESEKILRLLRENNGFLPYYDKSDPEEIYEFFGMSKKTFKMTVGKLYKEHKISLEKEGIKLAD